MWEYWIGTTYSSKENIITYSPILKYDKINTNNDAANIMKNLITPPNGVIRICFIQFDSVAKKVSLAYSPFSGSEIKKSLSVMAKPYPSPI